MELIEPSKPLEFIFKDVTFYVKPLCSAGDKAEILLIGENQGRGQVRVSAAAYVQTVLRRMILGWKGVTRQGREVPYSWEVFDQYFPKEDIVVLPLFNFIIEKTDVGQHKAEIKNGSREQPTGSPESEGSAALAKTA